MHIDAYSLNALDNTPNWPAKTDTTKKQKGKVKQRRRNVCKMKGNAPLECKRKPKKLKNSQLVLTRTTLVHSRALHYLSARAACFARVSAQVSSHARHPLHSASE